MLRQFNGVLNIVVFNMDPKDEKHAETVKKFKLGGVSAGKPKMRFYPNRFKGTMKMSKSYRIFFDLNAKDLKKITKQIDDGFETTIISSLDRTINAYVSEHVKDKGAKKGKDVVFLMYRKNQKLDLKFKALSDHPLFRDNTQFLAVKDPDFEKLNMRNMN